MSNQINRETAAALWDAMTVSVFKPNTVVRFHPQSVFLGYLGSIRVDCSRVLPGFVLRLRNIGVKVLNGKPYLEMPGDVLRDATNKPILDEKGRQQKPPHYFPETGELREVLTQKVFATAEVQEMIAEAERQKTAAPANAQNQTANPYRNASVQIPLTRSDIPAGKEFDRVAAGQFIDEEIPF